MTEHVEILAIRTAQAVIAIGEVVQNLPASEQNKEVIQEHLKELQKQLKSVPGSGLGLDEPNTYNRS